MGRFLFSPPLWGSIRVSLNTEPSTFIGSYWSRQCPNNQQGTNLVKGISNFSSFRGGGGEGFCSQTYRISWLFALNQIKHWGRGGVTLAQSDMSWLSHSIWLAYNLARRLFWMHCKLMDKDWNFWQSFLGGSHLSPSSGRSSVSWTSEIVDSTSLQYDTTVPVRPRPLKAWNCLG